jgi:hypothetical protein
MNKKILDNYKKGRILPNGTIITPWFRGAFMSIWEYEKPMKDDEEPSKHSVTMLFDRDEVDLGIVKEAMGKLLKERFPKLAGKKLPDDFKNPIRNGDDKDYEGFAGCDFVKATTKKTVAVYDQATNRVAKPSKGENDPIYSGAYYIACISPWAFDKAGARGMGFNLISLQKICDGDSFAGAGGSDGSEFGTVSGYEGQESGFSRVEDEETPF